LVNANGLTLDAQTNVYVTVSNAVLKVTQNGVVSTAANVTNVANVLLKGIASLTSGNLAACDFNNHAVWLINPQDHTVARLTGFLGSGDQCGASNYARLFQPYGIAAAGGGMLVVADYGNNRVKTVSPIGTVTNLYGVHSNYWVTGSGTYPGWWDGAVCPGGGDPNYNCTGWAEARLPAGVAVAADGSVFATEDYYHLVRVVTSSGLAGPESAAAPVITNQPVSQTVNIGGSAIFCVGATGLQPLSYQWKLNHTAILGATASCYAINNAQASDEGSYTVDVSNPVGVVTSTNANLKVNLPPHIDTQPADLEVAAGSNATFFVVASPSGLLTYQWRFNGASIAGATLSSYTRTNSQALDSGNYSVVVANTAGSVTSSNALLTVDTPPIITVQPVGQVVRVGSNVTFNVAAIGAAPLSYQWRLNGTNLVGQVNTNLTLLNVQVADAGPYSVVVTNGFGSVTSSIATLAVIAAPVFYPNWGYYPMGQTITVQSGLPDVFYTIDGTEPTTNSTRVVITGNTGTLRWINSTNDLTGLRLKAFAGTNSSETVTGVSAPTNNVGVPPGLSTNLYAGIGSTLIVPVVANLRTNDQVRSYQFRVEVTPNGVAPAVSGAFGVLDISSNDFITVTTAAQGSAPATISVSSYTNGPTRGLVVSAIGTNANVVFRRFAVVAMLSVRLPGNAQPGQSYAVRVLESSATSDGGQTVVPFPPMPAATVIITNIPYTVGDSALGGWYNAGEFGNRDLDNADVNNAFYAAAGLRLPYPNTDVFDTMDAYPDDAGTTPRAGGDGEIRFLDWQIILRRALRLDPNNWARALSTGGRRTNVATVLIPSAPDDSEGTSVGAPWNRQALVGARSVGGAVAGATVDVPVYVRVADGASLSGMQFRAIVTADNGGPGIAATPQFIAAAGVPTPIQSSFSANELACGWSLGSFSFGSRTSNYLGVLRFTIPNVAQSGQTYTVTFANADGSPDLYTQYDFETKRGMVAVGVAAPVSGDITSDDWKVYFFGSVTAPEASPNADPDNDGVANWAEYIAGTDPTDAGSRLKFDPAVACVVSGQRQVVLSWLSAPSRAYEVQGASSANGTWSVLGTVSGTGDVVQFIETNPGTPRLYRLRVLP
jgi:hypothetical protein